MAHDAIRGLDLAIKSLDYDLVCNICEKLLASDARGIGAADRALIMHHYGYALTQSPTRDPVESLPTAIDNLTKAEVAFRALDRLDATALSLHHLSHAWALMPLGNSSDNAEQQLRYADSTLVLLTRHPRITFPTLSMAYNSLSTAYRRRTKGERANNRRKALDFANLAVATARRTRNLEDLAQGLISLGSAEIDIFVIGDAEKSANIEAAIRHLSEARNLSTALSSPAMLHSAILSLCDALVQHPTRSGRTAWFGIALYLLESNIGDAEETGEVAMWLASICAAISILGKHAIYFGPEALDRLLDLSNRCPPQSSPRLAPHYRAQIACEFGTALVHLVNGGADWTDRVTNSTIDDEDDPFALAARANGLFRTSTLKSQTFSGSDLSDRSRRGLISRAKEAFGTSIHSSFEGNFPEQFSHAEIGLGDLEMADGNFAHARDHYVEAAEAFEQMTTSSFSWIGLLDIVRRYVPIYAKIAACEMLERRYSDAFVSLDRGKVLIARAMDLLIDQQHVYRTGPIHELLAKRTAYLNALDKTMGYGSNNVQAASLEAAVAKIGKSLQELGYKPPLLSKAGLLTVADTSAVLDPDDTVVAVLMAGSFSFALFVQKGQSSIADADVIELPGLTATSLSLWLNWDGHSNGQGWSAALCHFNTASRMVAVSNPYRRGHAHSLVGARVYSIWPQNLVYSII